MKLTNIAIDNRTSVFIILIIIVIMGLYSYITLPRESRPDISIPLVIVSTQYFGVSPEDIESLVTQKIEKEINAIGEVKEITSSSFEGYSLIRVEFESGYNIDEAVQKVRDKVNKAEPELPPDAEKPEIIEINFSEFPILTINISGPFSLSKLKDVAEDIEDDIEKVEGVLDVKIKGGIEREVKVDVDINKINHYNVRFDDIITSIMAENRTIPGGTIDINNSSFMVRVPGEFREPYLIDNIIVKLKDGAPVYVKDIADVSYGFKDRSQYARLNGENAVSIDVSKRVGENIIEIADNVKELLVKKNSELPEELNIYITTDESKDIKSMVRELENNIFSGLVLVLLVLFFFLGIRNAFFVAIAVPLSMLMSLLILQFSGVTLNFVVLFALILALGMLVDNAIVIIENIYKFLEDGHSLLEAAKLGTAEVSWPVFTSTMTTVAAFSPLLFWPGVIGDFMIYIPLVLIITLLSSLFVALVINPVVASVFMKLERPDFEPQTIFEKILHGINKITHFFVDIILPQVLARYKLILLKALGPPRKPDQKVNRRNKYGILVILPFFIVTGVIANILPGGLAVFLSIVMGIGIVFLFTNSKLRVLWGTLLLLYSITEIYGLFGHGIELFPKTQPPRIFISIEAPSGTSLDMSNHIVSEIEKKLSQYDNNDVQDVVAVVGASNNPFDGGSSTPNKSTISIQFVDYSVRKKSSLTSTDEIRDFAIKTAGAEVLVQQQEMGPPVGPPINIEVSGDDYRVLGELAEMIRETIKETPGLVDLKDDFDVGKPEIRVDIDREKAALYGMNTGMIANAIRTAINGSTASKYRVGEDEYDITVRLKEEQRSSLNSLRNLEIIYNNKKGTTLTVPLISVANISRSKGPGAIRRKELKRVITVSANVAQEYNANDVLNNVKEELADFKIPAGYSIDYTGQNKEQAKASAFLSKAFSIAILLIFLILVIQFNSLSQPLIIMSAVVISLIGVFIGLITYSIPFGIIMTGIGVISLAGVVVNNNIVLIDYINVLRRRGITRREAIIRAGLRRFRPVTLTAMTTILGLIPLTFGFGFDIYTFSFSDSGESAEFWKSMGIAVIFGLAFATVLTLIIVPTFYSTLDDVVHVVQNFYKKHIRKR
jgi:multidrug efflux pump subunit AcrB